MLPPTIVNQLEMQGYGTESRIEHQLISCRHQGVCILFADVAGFSELTTVASPSSVMSFLNNVFESLDHLTDMYNVYKVETVGDCYVAAWSNTLADMWVTNYKCLLVVTGSCWL